MNYIIALAITFLIIFSIYQLYIIIFKYYYSINNPYTVDLYLNKKYRFAINYYKVVGTISLYLSVLFMLEIISE